MSAPNPPLFFPVLGHFSLTSLTVVSLMTVWSRFPIWGHFHPPPFPPCSTHGLLGVLIDLVFPLLPPPVFFLVAYRLSGEVSKGRQSGRVLGYGFTLRLMVVGARVVFSFPLCRRGSPSFLSVSQSLFFFSVLCPPPVENVPSLPAFPRFRPGR